MDTEAFLIRERYKVTQVLTAQKDYAALIAVDIQSRENVAYLLNIYEGELLRPFLGCFEKLRFCPQHKGMFLSGESLVEVFDYRRGEEIDTVFCKGAEVDWSFRLDLAQAVLHQMLSMADFPPEVSCAGMLSENLAVFPDERKLGVNFIVKPMQGVSERELVLLTIDQLRKVLIHRWDSPKKEREFLRELRTRAWPSAVELYSLWTASEPDIRADYEKLNKRWVLSRFLYLLFMNLAWWFENKFRRRKVRT